MLLRTPLLSASGKALLSLRLPPKPRFLKTSTIHKRPFYTREVYNSQNTNKIILDIESVQDIKTATALFSRINKGDNLRKSLSLTLIPSPSLISPEELKSSGIQLATSLNQITDLEFLSIKNDNERSPEETPFFSTAFIEQLDTSKVEEISLIYSTQKETDTFIQNISKGNFPQLKLISSVYSAWDNDQIIKLYRALTGHKKIEAINLYHCSTNNLDPIAHRDALSMLAVNTPSLQKLRLYNHNLDLDPIYEILNEIGFEKTPDCQDNSLRRKYK